MKDKGLTWLMKYNPVVAWLDLFRHPLLNGELPTWNNCMIAIGSVSVCVTLASPDPDAAATSADLLPLSPR